MRNTYIYPPEPSMRLIGDIFAYTQKVLSLLAVRRCGGMIVSTYAMPVSFRSCFAYTLHPSLPISQYSITSCMHRTLAMSHYPITRSHLMIPSHTYTILPTPTVPYHTL